MAEISPAHSCESLTLLCRKQIGFALVLHPLRSAIGLKKTRPLRQPIIRKTKINRDSLGYVFPRFASATRFSSVEVLIGSQVSLRSL